MIGESARAVHLCSELLFRVHFKHLFRQLGKRHKLAIPETVLPVIPNSVHVEVDFLQYPPCCELECVRNRETFTVHAIFLLRQGVGIRTRERPCWQSSRSESRFQTSSMISVCQRQPEGLEKKVEKTWEKPNKKVFKLNSCSLTNIPSPPLAGRERVSLPLMKGCGTGNVW